MEVQSQHLTQENFWLHSGDSTENHLCSKHCKLNDNIEIPIEIGCAKKQRQQNKESNRINNQHHKNKNKTPSCSKKSASSNNILNESNYINSLRLIFPNNMPPISEKRSPPIIKENAKENISTPKSLCEKLNNRGPEILDFRESWLKEIDLYKDQVRAQQLLTQHNHLHTPDGCQRDAQKDGIKVIEPVKRRIRTRSGSDPNDPNARAKPSTKDIDDDRAREDNHSNHTHNYPTVNGSQLSPQPTQQSAPALSLSPKIIVNVHHASLLNTPASIEKTQKVPALLMSPASTPNAAGTSSIQQQTAAHSNIPSTHLNATPSITPTKKSKPTTKSLMASTTSGAPQSSSVTPSNGKECILPVSLPMPTTSQPSSPTSTNNSSSLAESVDSQPHEGQNVRKFETDPQLTSSSDKDQSGYHSESECSTLEDDEDFTELDDNDVDDSSDSEDEYRGYSYMIDSDEEFDVIESQFTMPSILKSTTTANGSNNVNNECQYTTATSPFTPSLFPNVPPYLTFSSHIQKGPAMPSDVQKILKWKLTSVMPRIVRRVVINSGLRLIKKTNDWMGTWEKHMKSPLFKTIRSHQKFNHLPGTFKIGRKDSVWKNLRVCIAKHGKREFGFMQKTFIMPQDLQMLKRAWPKLSQQNTKWIIKPPASARGTGIKVVSRWSQIPKQKPLIVQKYIEKPLLINGSKFDLRLYVLVTSINPLRIYMHTNGLARFASVQYSNKLETLNDRCMHLTNYSINKLSESYAKNEDINACQGHKWTLKSLWSYFEQRHINTKKLWGTLRNLVIRTLVSGESSLNKTYKANVISRYSCYELFGFDVLLDENLTPWLLEVNISPSLHSELPLDMHVKGPLVQAVLNTALFQVPAKLSEQQEQKVVSDYGLTGRLCYDKRLYVTFLSPEEIKKHNFYTSKAIDCREEYIESILDDLTPDDIRCLINTEDELARSSPLERIFPGQKSYHYLQYIESPRYYNRLLDAWETRYGRNRSEGIKLLQQLCESKRHLEVPPTPQNKQSCERELPGEENDDDPKSEDVTDSVDAQSSIAETTTIQDSEQSSEKDMQNETLHSHIGSNQVKVKTAAPQQPNQMNGKICSGPRPITVEIK